jgi:hypothetical protein
MELHVENEDQVSFWLKPYQEKSRAGLAMPARYTAPPSADVIPGNAPLEFERTQTTAANHRRAASLPRIYHRVPSEDQLLQVITSAR